MVAQAGESLSPGRQHHGAGIPMAPAPLVPSWDSPWCLGQDAGRSCRARCRARAAPSSPLHPHPMAHPLQPSRTQGNSTASSQAMIPKSFTQVPAPVALPGRDFALIWRFPEPVGGNGALLGNDCIPGWGQSRKHPVQPGSCLPTCPPTYTLPAHRQLTPSPLLAGTLISAPNPMYWPGSALCTQASGWEWCRIGQDWGQAQGHMLPGDPQCCLFHLHLAGGRGDAGGVAGHPDPCQGQPAG